MGDTVEDSIVEGRSGMKETQGPGKVVKWGSCCSCGSY